MGITSGQGEPAETEVRIQEICDQLHRLESLISVAVPLPPEPPAAADRRFVYFGSAIDFAASPDRHREA